MKALIISKKGIRKGTLSIAHTLKELNIDNEINDNPTPEDFSKADIAIAIGGDGDVLKVVHSLKSESIPLLGVSESDGESFLTVGISNFKEAIKKIVKSEFWVEEAVRLKITVDGIELPPALNEVALFPSKSATLMEYLLKVNGEYMWRDYGDGLILSTPTGATAYAMSAGGPMVHPLADVILIVPVNSLDVTRRPLIVSDSADIEVEDLGSRYECEAIVDGTLRVKVKKHLSISKMSLPAKLIRLQGSSSTQQKLTQKVKLAEELQKMPPSAKLVLQTLKYEGPLSQKNISEKAMLPDRTTRLAISLLLEKKLLKRLQSLRDARHKTYQIA